jgi:hypothetical protein
VEMNVKRLDSHYITGNAVCGSHGTVGSNLTLSASRWIDCKVAAARMAAETLGRRFSRRPSSMRRTSA